MYKYLLLIDANEKNLIAAVKTMIKSHRKPISETQQLRKFESLLKN